MLSEALAEQESGDDEAEKLNEDAASGQEPKKRAWTKGDILRNTDHSFLWIINTDGCIRQILMKLMGDQDDWHSATSTPSPCYSHCIIDAHEDPRLHGLLPEPFSREAEIPDHLEQTAPPVPLAPW